MQGSFETCGFSCRHTPILPNWCDIAAPATNPTTRRSGDRHKTTTLGTQSPFKVAAAETEPTAALVDVVTTVSVTLSAFESTPWPRSQLQARPLWLILSSAGPNPPPRSTTDGRAGRSLWPEHFYSRILAYFTPGDSAASSRTKQASQLSRRPLRRVREGNWARRKRFRSKAVVARSAWLQANCGALVGPRLVGYPSRRFVDEAFDPTRPLCSEAQPLRAATDC